MTTSNWIGGSGNWDTASDWNPLGPPTASSTATILGTTTETVVVESPEAAQTVILDDPNAIIGIGGATGAALTVGMTLAIEEGTLGVGEIGTLKAAHIRIAAPEGSTSPTNGVLWFLAMVRSTRLWKIMEQSRPRAPGARSTSKEK